MLLVQEHHASSQLDQVPLYTLRSQPEGFLGFVLFFALYTTLPPVGKKKKVQIFLTLSKLKALIYLS